MNTKLSTEPVNITTTDIYKKICTIAAEEILADSSNPIYDPDKDLVSDCGFDDLDTIQFVMCLEEDFDCAISDNEAEKIKTFRDAYNVVIGKLKK